MMFAKACLILIVSLVCVAYAEENFGRGFNDNIKWTNDLEGAKAKAKEEGKPLMVLIHKSWCGACKRLKTVFADSAEILNQSGKFICVNLEDDEEPAGKEWTPDGGYIPRLMFVHADGSFMKITNEGGNPKYAYYYSSAEQILNSMAKANTAHLARV